MRVTTGVGSVRRRVAAAICAREHALVGVIDVQPPAEACDASDLDGDGVWLFVVAGRDADAAGERFDAVAERVQPRHGVLVIGCAELRAGEDARTVIDRALANHARAGATRVVDPATGRWVRRAAARPVGDHGPSAR